MAASSQKFVFDNRLLAIEELFRQRRFEASRRDLSSLKESDFAGDTYQLGLYLSLKADALFTEGEYHKALEYGGRGADLLADFPLNRRYARVLLVIARSLMSIGDLKNAEMKAHDSLASYRRASDSLGQVDALNELAYLAFLKSDYSLACQFLDDAVVLAASDPKKTALLTGNVGRIRILTGQWHQAESDLRSALDYSEKNGEEMSLAVNKLSLAYLHLRRREHLFCDRCLSEALEIIERLNLKREKVIYLEYLGELALEKGDILKAKSLLTEAYRLGKLLAPESSLVSQSSRRLAEAEFLLDNLDEAMKYGQKALELATLIGERAEVAVAHRVIGQVFAAKSTFDEALEHGSLAVEKARVAGDPVDLARTLLVMADLLTEVESDEVDRIRSYYDEACRIFKKLKLDYWVAETDYRIGVFACRQGDLSRGFKKLNRSERTFTSLAEAAKVRRVSQFLTSLADQAVALSVSENNEFRLFGKLINQDEVEELRAGQLDEIVQVLMNRTGADRAIVLAPEFDAEPIATSFDLPGQAASLFAESFNRLLGEEISTIKPTVLLDCRRDPYINDLFHDIPDIVASVVVVPFRMSDNIISYVYLDRLSDDNTLNPFNQEELNFAVGFSDIIAFKLAELQRLKLLEDNRQLKAQLKQEAAFPNIITQSSKMLELLSQVRQVVDSNISVAIEGPTGSGKDLLARAIHYNSIRRDKRFISVNCAALPETLLESELFGYRRGAFTGADRDKPGLFEEANGGTFFLDEIADMPLSIQAKILRVLEEREIVRLGDSVPRKVDIRIISATNKTLKDEMANGRFRQDLYYRLAALTFHIPSLCERREDIPLLAERFLQGSGKSLSAETMKYLAQYDWPGNVRELENEVKKLALLAGDSQEIGHETLSSKLLSEKGDNGSDPSDELVSEDDVVFDSQYSMYDYLAARERRFIIRALRDRNGVKKHAAALLSIPESTLRLKIKEYRIDINRLDAIN